MQRLKVSLEHCYGIRRLEQEFDFTQCNAVALYAPNGTMKSSLAKTFQDIAEGKTSSDRMFPSRETKRSVVDEAGVQVEPQTVLVVRPYDEDFAAGEKASTLLVNARLRKEYEKLNSGVEEAKRAFLDRMKQESGSKRDLAAEISSTFTRSPNQLLTAILRVNEEVQNQSDAPYASIPYDLVFDDKVMEMLGQEKVQGALEEYVKRFNELIDRSTYFRRGVFTYYNATEIAKALAGNGFFDAAHSVSLNADKRIEIKSKKDLEELIAAEKSEITSDPELRKMFVDVEKLLYKNVTLRDFNAYISDHEDVLPELTNPADFKEKVWKSYFVKNKPFFDRLVNEVRLAADRRKEIELAAQSERTAWQEVIEIFNQRFFVPFELKVKNLVSMVLNEEKIPKLGFVFKEGSDRKDVERGELLEVLSTGERKALYILNIIFEIQARMRLGQRTLMIVDDVADSFDYRNKYAIIQYLKDVSEDANFRQIILTHNFDFFRTVESRFVRYNSCFMVSRNDDGVQVNRATGIKNIFVKDWKINFGSAPRKRIASIPFMRNIVEFTKGADDDYAELTALLHVKATTDQITDAELFQLYARIFGGPPANSAQTSGTVEAMIYSEADACLSAPEGANFENKIVLSIAARLRAERFMISRIADPAFLAAIRGNQTTALLSRFRSQYPQDSAIGVVDKVVLMTPENIHLNSFMIEPILDMSDEHLRKVYSDVRALMGQEIQG